MPRTPNNRRGGGTATAVATPSTTTSSFAAWPMDFSTSASPCNSSCATPSFETSSSTSLAYPDGSSASTSFHFSGQSRLTSVSPNFVSSNPRPIPNPTRRQTVVACRSSPQLEKFILNWEVENFVMVRNFAQIGALHDSYPGVLKSANFGNEVTGELWLDLRPNGLPSHLGAVSIVLRANGNGPNSKASNFAHFSVMLVDEKDEEESDIERVLIGGSLRVKCEVEVYVGLQQHQAELKGSCGSLGLSEQIAAIYFESLCPGDVQLICGGKTFQACRMILAARSSVFKAMLYGPFKENNGQVEITDVSSAVMSHVLQFLHTDRCALLEDCNADYTMGLELLLAADKYRVKSPSYHHHMDPMVQLQHISASNATVPSEAEMNEWLDEFDGQ